MSDCPTSARHSIRTSLRAAAWIALALGAAFDAAAQRSFTDDAGRTVELPATIERVFAAGAPAEILLYTLVPEMLAGRNHLPTPAALELMPPELKNPRPIVNLPDRDDPRDDGELLALDPDVYVDYGDLDDDYVDALEAITARTRVPGIILDGRLPNVPNVYRDLGAALGVAERGARLAAEADRLLSKYRGSLANAGVKAYLACSSNGLTPCLAGHSFGEAAELLGATNVAGSTATAARRPLALDEIRALAPTVIIAANRASADALRNDPAWRALPAVAAGRVHAPPDAPFNWGPRPPSVNRLLGVVWLAYALPGRAFDDAFFADVEAFFVAFYHFTATREELRALVAEG